MLLFSFLNYISYNILNVNILFLLVIISVSLIFIAIIKTRSKKVKSLDRLSIKTYLEREREFENFIAKFIENLKFIKSPEAALLYTSKIYNGKFSDIIFQNISLGLSIGEIFNNLSNFFPSNKRVLNLFSRSLSYDTTRFISISDDVLKYIKETIYLKNQIEALLTKVRIKMTVLSISSSATLALLSKIIPFILNLIIIETNISMYFPLFNDLSLVSFLLFLTISLYNTYIVSKTIFHSHSIILSILSSLIFIFLYILTPEVGARF